jgi:hypothetical protein
VERTAAPRRSFDAISERGRPAADLKKGMVYAGISLGCSRRRCWRSTSRRQTSITADPSSGLRRPRSVPGDPMEADQWADVRVAREMAGNVHSADLVMYAATGTPFTDSTLPDYDYTPQRCFIGADAASSTRIE